MGVTLSWLAGFFDGEGCITLYSSTAKGKSARRLLYPRVSLTNTDLPILKVIQAQFSGTIHSYRPKYKNAKMCHVIVWQNQKALALLKEIAPYLLVKKTQAELVIAGFPTKNPSGKKLSDEEVSQRVQLQSQITELKQKEFLQ